MVKDGKGGANTLTGLEFEKKVDLLSLLKTIEGYSVREFSKKTGSEVYFNDKLIARTFKKHDFYRYLKENGVDWKKIISKRLLPDDALLVIESKTLFIIEVKFQQRMGSVDEKLQTGDFKRKQYLKLVQSLGLKVKYVYVLNDWFKNPAYKDVLDYINSVDCYYRFKEIPLAWLGLPL